MRLDESGFYLLEETGETKYLLEIGLQYLHIGQPSPYSASRDHRSTPRGERDLDCHFILFLIPNLKEMIKFTLKAIDIF